MGKVNDTDFCPECGIGLNSGEINMMIWRIK